MAFTEKPALKDELRPLLRDPAQNQNNGYGRNYDVEDMDHLLGLGGKRSQRVQWMLFFGVTVLSVLILLATLGVLLQISQNRPYSGLPNEPALPEDPIPNANPQAPVSILEAEAPIPKDNSVLPSTNSTSLT